MLTLPRGATVVKPCQRTAELYDLTAKLLIGEGRCERQNPLLRESQYDTVVNKTPLSYKANRMIGGVAPSLYLSKLQKHEQVKMDDASMDGILLTHAIEPGLLRADDFHGFYAARKQALLALIVQVMGKPVLQVEPRAATTINDDEAELGEAQQA